MSTPRATAVEAAGRWHGEAAETVVLDFDERHRRRVAMTGTGGLAFLLDLPEPVMLRGGDALRLEDGRLVEVVAAPEPLVEVRGRVPADLVRLAWHIGNRHLPAQIMPAALRIRSDAVIEAMLAGLGARLRPIEAPFDPEGGAYAGGANVPDHHDHGDGPAPQDRHHHGHNHGHDHHHGHDHGGHGRHEHGPSGHDHAQPHEHSHSK